MKYLLAIDQGTTSTRALLFNTNGMPIVQHQIELKQHFPKSGWVEHDADEIWQATSAVCEHVLQAQKISAKEVIAIGISNQRETTVIWNKETGQVLHPAIVWQDRRTAEQCDRLRQQNCEDYIRQTTGLLLDPYFSATKLQWLLENIPEARACADQNKLAFGTIDSFLIWRLTGGKSHVTDATNAARTLLFNLKTQTWDQQLLKLFNIPENILPRVLNCSDDFGMTEANFLGSSIPIRGVAGDQQAATIGQACFSTGMAKCTYGTGCFLLVNTGDQFVITKQPLLTTIAYRFNHKITYALEGSIFIAGAAVQWLRDGLHLIKNSNEIESLATTLSDNQGIYLVPAFTGLGAPYWNPYARGAIIGLTRDTQVSHLARATLEAVCYQTRDLISVIQSENILIPELRVDGGMTANHFTMQFLADILKIKINVSQTSETSALGAAYLAGLGAGVYSSLDDIKKLRQEKEIFLNNMSTEKSDFYYLGWQKAVRAVLSTVG